jgi:hypothetical protein
MLRRIRSEEIEILQVIRISAKLLRLTSFPINRDLPTAFTISDARGW